VKKILRKVIPSVVLVSMRKKQLRMTRLLISWCSTNKKLSSLYYLFSGGFSREHQSVLQGRIAYHASLDSITDSFTLLRRNTHRLEKGLIMRPRRRLFAEGFILETVQAYRDAIILNSINQSEIKWATDVLDEYFTVVSFSQVISKARDIYTKSRRVGEIEIHELGLPCVDGKYKPYKYTEIIESKVTFDSIKKLFAQRRSVRWYEEKKVSLELVQQAADIASLAPSACNRQPYRFVFCNTRDKAIEIAKCAGGTRGFAENIPAIIAIVGDLSAYPFDKDRHLIYIDGSLAAMQLMLALETLGLSSCSINWPEDEYSERRIRKIIELKDYERVVMLLTVGYADHTGGIPYSQKKTKDLILKDISS